MMSPAGMEGAFVTILFTDLVGSSALFARHGDEAADALRREHYDALRRAAAGHGGTVVKSTGDGLMVTFPSAVAAVRCAVAMQRATTGAADGLELRIGLDAGEPLPDDDDFYGMPVIVASRLCDAAGAGEILATAVVCQIAGSRIAEPIEPAGAMRLRGVAERIATARVRWREDGAVAPAPPEPATIARPIRVVVADDQRLVRAGFRVILEE
jgi:adenylate cyclase